MGNAKPDSSQNTILQLLNSTVLLCLYWEKRVNASGRKLLVFPKPAWLTETEEDHLTEHKNYIVNLGQKRWRNACMLCWWCVDFGEKRFSQLCEKPIFYF